MHDFSFYRIVPAAIRYLGGFGKIHWVDMQSYTVAQAERFAREETHLLEALNAPGSKAMRQLLRQRGIGVAQARVIGLDCDGFDLHAGGKLLRLDFPEALSRPSLDALSPPAGS